MAQSAYGLLEATLGAGLFVPAPALPAQGKDFFMPENAPLVVLAFLAAAGGLAMALLVVGFAAATRRWKLAKGVSAAAALGLAGYVGAILFCSFRSEDRVLRPGDRKYFCEIDCHLAYSLEGVRRAKTLGSPDRPVTASGEFAVVTIRTWFDERTICPRREDASLTPNPRAVFVLDEAGRRYASSSAAEKALSETGVRSMPMMKVLRPGESFVTVLAFDLPPGIRKPRLLVTDDGAVERFLIGHENSFFHRKISFELR
jgi:hypothetical protein